MIFIFILKVDWGKGATTMCYNHARKRTEDVGKAIAMFLDFVIGDNANKWDQLTLVGHSLGAHIAGYAGKNVQNGKIGTILGLDPAGPFFDLNDPKTRLNSNDAKYVEAIHTDSKCYGIANSIGTTDFYINGGERQKGCLFDVCHHLRVVDLFVESIGKKNKFNAYKCGEKRGGSDVLMGGEPGNLKKRLSGDYCLNTRGDSPYGKGQTKPNKKKKKKRKSSNIVDLFF